MGSFKKDDLKRDVSTGELIRINYLCSRAFKTKLQEVTKLLEQVRL